MDEARVKLKNKAMMEALWASFLLQEFVRDCISTDGGSEHDPDWCITSGSAHAETAFKLYGDFLRKYHAS